MARRGVFQNIKEAAMPPQERKPASNYTERGASRNMISSIGELAEKAAKADQYLAGATVIDVDPDLIDASFVNDRMLEEDEAFDELVEAIRDRGQDSPVLLRPHPQEKQRFQIVFGHRRVRAARKLDRKVKAVVRDVSDVDHVIAQGQENSARENLTFIERALFAEQLVTLGYDRPTVQAALSVDAPMLTRMLSVTSRLPNEITTAIGPAKGIGRDRWLDLAQAMQHPQSQQSALALVAAADFDGISSDERFERVLKEAKSKARARHASTSKPEKSRWQPKDKAVSAEFVDTGKSFAVSFKAKEASRFGRYLASNLDRLYGEFKESVKEEG